jgi:hypothetical protein
MKKIYYLLPVVLICLLMSQSLSAQKISDFHATWTGTDNYGQNIELTLLPNWNCTYKVNGTVQTNIVAYRIYLPTGSKVANQAASANLIKIKFFTPDAIAGITCTGLNMSGQIVSYDKTYSGNVSLDQTRQKMTLNIDFSIDPCNPTQVINDAGAQMVLSK